jgi:hypothetical protein
MPLVTPLRAADPRRVGRYRLAGRISGMPAAGPVYLARTVDGSEVTVTLLGGDLAADGAARDRFAAEASVARRVAPFCAARILDSGLDGGQAFLVSEYVAGPSLLEVISAGGVRHGTELEALAVGAATGLAAIHQAGLVHGSFGPEHLLLSAAGPRVVEFGITPPYGAATPAADMLAWAQTVVFAAAGSPSGHGDLEVLPEPLRQMIAACLSTDPAARPAARSVLQQLLGDDNPPAGLLAQGSRRSAQASVSAVPAPMATPRTTTRTTTRAGHRPPRRPAGRRRMIAALSAAGALILVVLAALLINHWLTGRSQAGALRPESDGGTIASPAAGSGASSAPARQSPAPSATAVVPGALAGTWLGQARQTNPSDVFRVRVTLTAGGHTGTISYSGATFSCSGDLSMVAFADGTLTMDQGIVTGQTTCANGTVTLRQGSFGTLIFTFQGRSGPAARGTLAKR